MKDQGPTEGDQFGHYQLRRLLGRGGMGEVYEAYDTVKDRVVALKILPPRLAADPVFRARFQRESRAAARLQEAHVIPIHDYGDFDGVLFIDMRLVRGEDLASRLKARGPFEPRSAVHVVSQIASALDAAHRTGLVHRDIKPENILLTSDNFAYLVDFGIANAVGDETLTALGTAVGTYAYMAPERFDLSGGTDAAVDIYSLTCVLYECLTAQRPYPADSVRMVIGAHITAAIPKPSLVHPWIPSVIDSVVAQGMAKNPADRFSSTTELAAAAQRAVGDLPRAAEGPRPVLSPAASTAATIMPAAISPPENQPTQLGNRPDPPPQDTSRRNDSTKRRVLLGSGLAVVALAIVAGIVVLLTRSDDIVVGAKTTTTSPITTTTTPGGISTTTTTRTSEPAQPRPNPAQEELLAALPDGYATSSSCETIAAEAPATATISCEKHPSGNVVDVAYFRLYNRPVDMNARFNRDVSEDDVGTCPGRAAGPTEWFYTTSSVPAGLVFCGVFNLVPEIVWTDNSTNMIGVAMGSSIPDLHEWWMTYG